MAQDGVMIEGYAIVLASRRSDSRLRRCGVRIDVPAELLAAYQTDAMLHLQVVHDTIPLGYSIRWCSEWRRGTYSREEPLGGWQSTLCK